MSYAFGSSVQGVNRRPREDSNSSRDSVESSSSSKTVDKADHLRRLTNVYVSGAVGPLRSHPYDAFRPLHQSYSDAPPAGRHGYWGRAVAEDDEYANGSGFLEDRDLVTTWRLPSMLAAQEVLLWEQAFQTAIAHESLWIAIEAFVDLEPDFDRLPMHELLTRFTAYVNSVGRKPLTVTISSIVADMMQQSQELGAEFGAFGSAVNFATAVTDFVTTRECFFYHPLRAPYVEAMFQAMINNGAGQVDLAIHYTWNPPRIQLRDFRGVVREGERLLLRPTISNLGDIRRRDSGLQIEYYIGSYDGLDADWLRWSPEKEAFEGVVTRKIAEVSGTQRMDTYSFLMQLTAIVTNQFPHHVWYERAIRCIIPLTVKRSPDTCTTYGTFNKSPTGFRQTQPVQDVLWDTVRVKKRRARCDYATESVPRPWKQRDSSCIWEKPEDLKKLWSATAPAHRVSSYEKLGGRKASVFDLFGLGKENVERV